MKKTIIGSGLLILAAWILLEGNFGIPSLDIKIWPMILIFWLAYLAFESFRKSNIPGGVFLAIMAFFIANNSYDLLPISSGSLIMVGILVAIGLSLIFKPQKKWEKYGPKNWDSTTGDVKFGNGTLYIQSEDFTYERLDCSFGNATVYFDNAIIQGDSAVFEVDVSFGNATLYIPSHWRVELEVDNSFASVSNPYKKGMQDKLLRITGDVSFGRLDIRYI